MKYPPTMKLRKKDALIYLNVGSTTFDNYVKAGKLTHCDALPEDPRVKFYYVKDLNRIKALLGSRAGKRLSNKAAANIETIADAMPDVPASSSTDSTSLVPLAELDTVEARLMEAAGLPNTLTLHKAQSLLRQHVLLKAINSKVVNTLFEGLSALDEKVRRQSAKDILALILPQLKTVESVKVEDEETKQRNTKLQESIDRLREDIKNSRVVQPSTVIDADFRHIDV